MVNYSNIALIGSNVLVRLENSLSRVSSGIVLAIGPAAKEAEVGDRVFFYKSAGQLFSPDSSEPQVLIIVSQEFQAVEKNPNLDK